MATRRNLTEAFPLGIGYWLKAFQSLDVNLQYIVVEGNTIGTVCNKVEVTH